jgi:hypothetical protein
VNFMRLLLTAVAAVTLAELARRAWYRLGEIEAELLAAEQELAERD